MSLPRTHQGLIARSSANLGVGLVAACSALVLGTVWFLPAEPGGRTIAVVLTAISLIACLGLSRLRWERLRRPALLVFPALGAGGMTICALATRGISPAYTGFFTVIIFYVAATQSQRVTLASVPVCLPLLAVCQGGLNATVGVKL
jgi:phosphatidylserine synthase